MKILHTISGLSCTSGGPSTCTYELLRELNNQGVHADILTMAPQKGEIPIANDSFISFVENDSFHDLYSRNFLQRLYAINNQYDLFHTNGLWLFQNYCTAKIAKEFHKPYIITPHGMLYPYALARHKHIKRLMRFWGYDSVLEKANCIHVTCKEEAVHYRRLGFKNPVAIIPNCLHPIDNIEYYHSIHKQSFPKRILFLGRLHPIKNLDLL